MKKVITLFMLVCLTVAVMAATVFKPGTYTGQAKGRNGTVSVEVTVDGSKITAVKVLEHKETASIGSAAIEQIPGRIVSGQTLAVDAVSGASLTSRAILSAAEEALTKAANGDISQFMIKRQTQTAQKLKDEQTDVVIIGAGGAGMIAAIAVAQSGKNVILIEKQGLLGGGDSALTSTSVRGGGSRLISKLGIENATTEDFYNYLAKTAADKNIAADLDSLRVYAMRSGELIDYLTDLGVPFGKFNAASFSHTMTDGSAPGTHVVPALAREVVKNKIDYRLNTKAVSIIMNKGKAAGIAVESPDGKYNINAKEVITTGGYSANPELVAKYAPQWTNRPTTGAASLTGDGILMAEAVGADINNMEVVKANFLCYVLPSGDGVSMTALTNYVALVNHDGKRFVNEGHPSINYKSEVMMKQPKHEAYAIFDQKALDNLKLMRDYNENGYFISADSFEELADKLDVNKENFVQTMKKYQEYGKNQDDKEFGRKIQNPLNTPKYYAVLVTPAMQSTYGGIHVDTAARVLDKNMKPIPGLYAAGATSGHNAFANEIGAASIIAYVYGRIAGETAVKELK